MPKAHTVSTNFRRDCRKAGIAHITKAGKATFQSLLKNFIDAIVESGSDLKTIMTLARHGSAQMSMETYATAKTGRLREAVESASEQLREAIRGEACCTYVAQAVGAETAKPENELLSLVSGVDGVVTPTGFEPRVEAGQVGDTLGTERGQNGPKGHVAASSGGHHGDTSGHLEDGLADASCCIYVAQPEMPSDLASVVEAWEVLPEPVKAGIIAMVKASEG